MNKVKKYFNEWNKFELILLSIGIIAIISAGALCGSEIITVMCSVFSITTAMLQAKGKVESQFFGVLVSLIYSYVSYINKYYGEVIIYMIIMLPMNILGIISWLTHKNKETDTVEVNEIKMKEWILLGVTTIITFVGLYELLKYFNTNELIVSTFSMIFSFLSIYLMMRRSKYAFAFYLLNDIVLIILWGIPITAGNLLLIPLMIDPLILLISDTYGIFNWNKMENEQIN